MQTSISNCSLIFNSIITRAAIRWSPSLHQIQSLFQATNKSKDSQVPSQSGLRSQIVALFPRLSSITNLPSHSLEITNSNITQCKVVMKNLMPWWQSRSELGLPELVQVQASESMTAKATITISKRFQAACHHSHLRFRVGLMQQETVLPQTPHNIVIRTVQVSLSSMLLREIISSEISVSPSLTSLFAKFLKIKTLKLWCKIWLRRELKPRVTHPNLWRVSVIIKDKRRQQSTIINNNQKMNLIFSVLKEEKMLERKHLCLTSMKPSFIHHLSQLKVLI